MAKQPRERNDGMKMDKSKQMPMMKDNSNHKKMSNQIKQHMMNLKKRM